MSGVTTETSETIFFGVDEAGYGPNIGPLVVACVSLRRTPNPKKRDWWKLFAPHLSRSGENGSFAVDDSKKILARPDGKELLHRTVSAFLGNYGVLGSRLSSLFESLDPQGSEPLRQEHWFDGDRDDLHHDRPEEDVARLRSALSAANCALECISIRVAFPSEFNEQLTSSGNKANVEQQMLRQLLCRRLDSAIERTDLDVTVDRLGGRKFYRELVEDLAGESFPVTVEESAHSSEYEFGRNDRRCRVRFQVEADSHSFPVALASMVAKYIREACMHQFNRHWSERIPDITPTAGYPNDAKRFLAQVRPQLEERQISMTHFWREK